MSITTVVSDKVEDLVEVIRQSSDISEEMRKAAEIAYQQFQKEREGGSYNSDLVAAIRSVARWFLGRPGFVVELKFPGDQSDFITDMVLFQDHAIGIDVVMAAILEEFSREHCLQRIKEKGVTEARLVATATRPIVVDGRIMSEAVVLYEEAVRY